MKTTQPAWPLPALVAAGLTLMLAVAVRSLTRTTEEPEPMVPEPPLVIDLDPPAEEAPPSEPERPRVHIRRRRVPGLTITQIQEAGLSLREAMHYRKREGGRVLCDLCPVRCLLAEGERGACASRVNIGGVLRAITYGRLVALNNDPIEKKPLFHFLPGTRSLSIAAAGCNLGCVFCQNWQISQALPESAQSLEATPEEVVAAAVRGGCDSIAYTYTEPTAFYEFMYDCATLARRRGLKNVYITCGYINPEPLRELSKVMDAANIDLKGFSEAFYATYCKASLAPVLEAIQVARQEGMWVEITNLMIPGANDNPQMVRDMCRWIKAGVGTDVPLHFSRFFPRYQLLDKPPTPASTLRMAAGIAREEGLHYVYLGNLAAEAGEDTLCPKCGRVLVRRSGYEVLRNDLTAGVCPTCRTPIAGLWTKTP